MEKKQYIIPTTETMDLRAMKATMDTPLFGPASMPGDPSPMPPRHPGDIIP